MKFSQLIPATFLALGLTGTGALVATAQTAPVEPKAPVTQAQPQRTDVQPDSDGRPGAHRDAQKGAQRHGQHGPQSDNRMHGGRGGSEIFETLFAQVDADGDGSVTQAEIDTFRETTVGNADVSGDGALSIEEFDSIYREFTRSRMVDAFQQLDADGSGAVEADEMDDRIGGIVDRMDRDGDSALTLQDRRRG